MEELPDIIAISLLKTPRSPNVNSYPSSILTFKRGFFNVENFNVNLQKRLNFLSFKLEKTSMYGSRLEL
jgi:hypothetical protein